MKLDTQVISAAFAFYFYYPVPTRERCAAPAGERGAA